MMRRRRIASTIALAVVFAAGCSSGAANTQASVQQTATPQPTVERVAEATAEPIVTPEPTPAPKPTATPEPAPTPETTAAPEPTPVVEEEPLFELEGELDLTTNELNAMIRFVETETGRAFLYPPRITVDASFESGLALDVETEFQRAEARDRVGLQLRRYQAMGLTTQSVSEATDNWFGGFSSGDFVAGQFRGDLDVVIVPPATQQFVIVHELVHALDHQHTDLTRTEFTDQALASGNYEQAIALGFVIEGRATDVETAWLRANRDQIPDAQPVGAPFAVPDALILSFVLQYSQGQRFIELRGGAAETWDLLVEPPPATEQLFLPDVTDEPIIDVDFPPADGPVLEQRAFGAIDMVLWPVTEGNPAAAARFWGGGASTMWGDDQQTCVRVALAGDDQADLAQLSNIYQAWAENEESRSARLEGERLFITSCAPYVP